MVIERGWPSLVVEIYPNYSSEQLELVGEKSRAEKKLYEAFQSQLNDDYMVLHHVLWISKKKHGAFDGESDFLVCHKEKGILVVEVKGGGIRLKARQWYTINQFGQEAPLTKDPFDQARDNMYAIKDQLAKSKRIPPQIANQFSWGYGVIFPDIEASHVPTLLQPHINESMIGSAQDLKDIDSWLTSLFEFHNREGRGGTKNKIIRQAIRELFAREIDIRVGRTSMYAEIDTKLIRLTDEQFRLLDFINNEHRAAISGGAGTGKTVLAVEKAKRLAAQGNKTVFLCYNKLLADKLAIQLSGFTNISVYTVHAFFRNLVEKHSALTGRDYLGEYSSISTDETRFFNEVLPNAAMKAIDDLKPEIDAMVIDEAQDFSDLFWFPVESIINYGGEKPLYVFFDTAQNIFNRKGIIPISTPPKILTKNCRNTTQIYNETYKNFVGPSTSDSEIQGPEVTYSVATSLDVAYKTLSSTLINMLNNTEGRDADIVILLGNGIDPRIAYEHLSNSPLPKPYAIAAAGAKGHNMIFVDSVARFKGLEAKCVFLVLNRESKFFDEDVYVGGTRATHELCITVIGSSSQYE